MVGPFGAAPRGPIVEGTGGEEGEVFGMKKMGGKKENENAEHGRDETISSGHWINEKEGALLCLGSRLR